MNRLERRWLMVLGAVLGLNLAAYLVFTLPRSLQQRGLSSRREVLRREIELERSRAADARETSEAIVANTKDAKRFFDETVGARRPGLLSSLREIEVLAAAQGLKVENQKFDAESLKELPLERMQVNMPMEGSYRQLVAFLQSLEQAPQFLTVDQIGVRRGAGQGQEQAKLDLVLSCYFRPTGESKP